MISSRFTQLVALVVLALLVTSGGAAAQGEGRTPTDVALVMSGVDPPPTVADGDFSAETSVFHLAAGGEPFRDPIQETVAFTREYAWVSDDLFNATSLPATFVGNATLTISLLSNTVTAGPIGGADVVFSLDVGYYQNNAPHFHQNDITATATPNLPVPPGTLPPGTAPAGVLDSSVSFVLDFEGANQVLVPVPGRLAYHLTVTSQQPADFTLVTDGHPTLSYVTGSPDDPDTDGDGIPDNLDDDSDNDEFSDEDEILVGSSPTDASSTPASDSDVCPELSYDEVFQQTGNPNQCPETGGFPWLMLIVLALVIVLLLGGGFAVLTVAGRKVKMTVSHDGFQAIEQGQTAEYELELVATGKKEEIVPVELALKGVPEDWSATLEPAHLTLYAGGEEPEPQIAILRLTPPGDEKYEAEAQVVVTATPTDEEGKTSALNPGSSVKTKTIANIGMTDPEGGKKKSKPRKQEAATEEPAEAEAPKAKRAGFLKRKAKGETVEEEAVDDAEAQATAAEAAKAAAPAAAGAAAATAAAGKPQIGMGKMSHDPEDFSEGDEVTTTVTVRNKGDEPVEALRLNLFVNDEKADTQVVALAPGDSAEVAFQWTAQPDENRVRIKGGLKGA